MSVKNRGKKQLQLEVGRPSTSSSPMRNINNTGQKRGVGHASLQYYSSRRTTLNNVSYKMRSTSSNATGKCFTKFLSAAPTILLTLPHFIWNNFIKKILWCKLSSQHNSHFFLCNCILTDDWWFTQHLKQWWCWNGLFISYKAVYGTVQDVMHIVYGLVVTRWLPPLIAITPLPLGLIPSHMVTLHLVLKVGILSQELFDQKIQET